MGEQGIQPVMGKVKQQEQDAHKSQKRLFKSYAALVLGKTLISNMLMLYLMSQFYTTMLHDMTYEGRIKLLAGMGISVVSALVRCKQVQQKFIGPAVPITVV